MKRCYRGSDALERLLKNDSFWVEDDSSHAFVKFHSRRLPARLRAMSKSRSAISQHGLPDLRRTAVTFAISTGAHVKVVQQIAGHSSAVTMLDVYAQLFADDAHASARAVDALLHPVGG